MAEHANNAMTSESYDVLPFFDNYGYQPETTWPTQTSKMDNLDPSNEVLESHRKSTCQDPREDMLRAQETQKKWYDKNREPTPKFRPGDQGPLDGWNIRTKRLLLKLNNNKFYSFKGVAKVGLYIYCCGGIGERRG